MASREKFALELLHYILGHMSTISLVAGDIVNVWQNIELIIHPDSFCTSRHISSMNKKDTSQSSLKPKAPFKWILCILFQQQHKNI